MAARKKNTGLGRGLDALFHEAETSVSTDGETVEGVRKIDIDDIKPNANQPRKTFDSDSLKDLADSIRANGLIQPIIVRSTEHGYEIVAGERRWRAARMAGLREIPCIERDLNEEQLALFAIIENMQREDLNPIEEAEGLQRMVKQFDLTQDQISKSVGKSRPYITNALRLLKLPEHVQQLLVEGKISSGHARALLALPDEKKQNELADRIVKEQLTVRKVEGIVSGGLKRKAKPRKIRKSPDILRVEEDLQRALGTKVNLNHRGRKGRIEIEYYSRGELERLIELLQGLQQ
ncbi:MAG: ParB/RepB/Spo0J family partition protein [Anaerovoracaceae bacterium]|jgi:ParB family chromosome partitioning protein